MTMKTKVFLLTIALLGTLVSAQKRSKVGIDYQLTTGSTSDVVVGKIVGSGSLDFSQLQIEDNSNKALALEAAVIPLPQKKSTSSTDNYDDAFLESVGLGAKGTDGNYFMCCNEPAVQISACNEDDLGKLIVSSEDIKIRSIDVPSKDNNNSTGKFGKGGQMRFSKSSHVALVFGNCQRTFDDESSTIHISGSITWTSYVVASTFPIYILITSLHVALCLWYRRLMQKNKESRIQVEEWIFITITLAALTALCETVNFATELYGSTEIMALKIIGMILSLAKHSVTRCLYLVLALGLGVATASLSKLTAWLAGIFLAVDLLGLWSMHMAFYIKVGIDLHFAVYIVRITEWIFTIWIPVALWRTMTYLKAHEENMKLVRYRWFLKIYFLAAALSMVESGLMRADRMFGWQTFNRSTLREGNDIVYLIIIACVAILWKPNPSQQLYSYVLLEDDDENKITDLEL